MEGFCVFCYFYLGGYLRIIFLMRRVFDFFSLVSTLVLKVSVVIRKKNFRIFLFDIGRWVFRGSVRFEFIGYRGRRRKAR